MHQEQRHLTHETLQAKGMTRALFGHPHSITWLTGFAPPIQLGPHLFAGGPPLLWYEDGQYTLFIVDAWAGNVKDFARQPGCSVIGHQGYTYDTPLAGTEHLIQTMRSVLGDPRSMADEIGLEAQHVPLAIAEALKEMWGAGVGFVYIDGWLEPLRQVKTAEELVKLRENFTLADIGQAAARQAVTEDKTEIAIWNAAHSAIEQAAGQRVPLGNDCLVNKRELNYTGWPLDYVINPEGSIIVDLGTGLDGYWSDGCATYYACRPTPEQQAMHQAVQETLELAISLVRPGVMVKEIDRQLRDFIKKAGYPDYPHHTGHGVGVSSHEAPRITPYSEELLQEGMVIMLEPGIYIPGEAAVRLEDGVLVTAGGAEVLTKHDKSLP